MPGKKSKSTSSSEVVRKARAGAAKQAEGSYYSSTSPREGPAIEESIEFGSSQERPFIEENVEMRESYSKLNAAAKKKVDSRVRRLVNEGMTHDTATRTALNEFEERKKQSAATKESARLGKEAKSKAMKRQAVDVRKFVGRPTPSIAKDLRLYQKDKDELEKNRAGLMRDKEALDRAEAALMTARRRFEEMRAHGEGRGAEFHRIIEEQERAKTDLMASLFEASKRIADMEELIRRNDARFERELETQQGVTAIIQGANRELREDRLREREIFEAELGEDRLRERERFAAELGEAQRGNINLEQRIIALEANARNQIDMLNAEIVAMRTVLSERSPIEFDLVQLERERNQIVDREVHVAIDELTNTIELLFIEAERGRLETDPLAFATQERERERELIYMINERAEPQREVQQLQVEATPAVIAGSLIAAGSMMTSSGMEAGPAPSVPLSVYKEASRALSGAVNTLANLRSQLPGEGEMIVPRGSQIVPQGYTAVDLRNSRLTRTDPYLTTSLRNYLGYQYDDPFNNRGILRNAISNIINQMVNTERFARANPHKTKLLALSTTAALDYSITGELGIRRVGPIVNAMWVAVSGLLAPMMPLGLEPASTFSFMYNNIPEVRQYVDLIYNKTVGLDIIYSSSTDLESLSYPMSSGLENPMIEGPTAIPPGSTQDTSNAPPPGPRSYGFLSYFDRHTGFPSTKDHSKSIATPLGPAQTNYHANQVPPRTPVYPNNLYMKTKNVPSIQDTIKDEVLSAATESLVKAIKGAKATKANQKMSKKFGVLSRSEKLKSIAESLVDYVTTKRKDSAKRAAELLMALNYDKSKEIAEKELFNAGKVTIPQFSRPVINNSQMF